MTGSGRRLELYLCARIGAFRRLARDLPQPTDTVVELGAAEGHTTLHLARRAQRVIAVEKTTQPLDRARARCGKLHNITWLQTDAFEPGEVLKLVPRADLVFIDIGGSTWPSLVLRLAAIYRHMLRPRALVVRNVELNDFAAAVTHFEDEAPPGPWRDPYRER